ncbi:uncharacterized protein LOC115664828 [Syzygium oleosum]|uniref:uncharacterized protein LOC115664828 n=1 Tax=Syzygium oleosum TaxID=219896 RepID=UPI0024BB8B8B|nr:uncharacterized protein LOC115664828 [Syzygium oleosum]
MADMLIDSASGNEIMSLMDGHSGYNHIFIAKEDVDKTTFRCPGAIGTFEWLAMPFGLKNAGATYQRTMNFVFHDMIGDFMEVYIDDIIVKSDKLHLSPSTSLFEDRYKTPFLLDKDTYFVRNSPKGFATSVYCLTSLLHNVSRLFMYFCRNGHLSYMAQKLLVLIEYSLKLLGENLESFPECQRKNRSNSGIVIPKMLNEEFKLL